MVVHYKLKGETTWYKADLKNEEFNVLGLKRHILVDKKMNSSATLELRNALTGETYVDDKIMIPNNATIIVKIISKKGNIKDIYHDENVATPKVKKEDDEKIAEKIDENFVNQIQSLESTDCEKMLNVLQHSIRFLTPDPVEKRKQQQQQQPQQQQQATVPPLFYTCHRCNQKGHFIQNCPTNGDPDFDIKVYKNATGIPKRFLSEHKNNDDLCDDDDQELFKTNDNKLRYITPNNQQFNRFFDKNYTEHPIAKSHFLLCPICKNELKNASFVCCCFLSFCDECIRQHVDVDEGNCPICKNIFTLQDIHENFALRFIISQSKKST